jgi:hypothetical protein
MTKRETAEMYRLMRRVHRLTATRRELDRYMELSRKDSYERKVSAK